MIEFEKPIFEVNKIKGTKIDKVTPLLEEIYTQNPDLYHPENGVIILNDGSYSRFNGLFNKIMLHFMSDERNNIQFHDLKEYTIYSNIDIDLYETILLTYVNYVFHKSFDCERKDPDDEELSKSVQKALISFEEELTKKYDLERVSNFREYIKKYVTYQGIDSQKDRSVVSDSKNIITVYNNLFYKHILKNIPKLPSVFRKRTFGHRYSDIQPISFYNINPEQYKLMNNYYREKNVKISVDTSFCFENEYRGSMFRLTINGTRNWDFYGAKRVQEVERCQDVMGKLANHFEKKGNRYTLKSSSGEPESGIDVFVNNPKHMNVVKLYAISDYSLMIPINHYFKSSEQCQEFIDNIING